MGSGTRRDDEVAQRVAGIRARLAAEPERARTSVVMRTELAGGMRCDAVGRKHTVPADEPRSVGGTDEVASPVEILVGALATCQAITYQVWAAALDIVLDRVVVEARGDIDLAGFFGLDDSARPGFSRFHLDVTLEGPEPPERYRLLRDEVDRHCPLLDAVSVPAEVVETVRWPGSG